MNEKRSINTETFAMAQKYTNKFFQEVQDIEGIRGDEKLIDLTYSMVYCLVWSVLWSGSKMYHEKHVIDSIVQNFVSVLGQAISDAEIPKKLQFILSDLDKEK